MITFSILPRSQHNAILSRMLIQLTFFWYTYLHNEYLRTKELSIPERRVESRKYQAGKKQQHTQNATLVLRVVSCMIGLSKYLPVRKLHQEYTYESIEYSGA